MKFRKLYWVTEQIDESGKSQVAGVFTSIPDLVDRGLHWCDGVEGKHNFRITLVKLDSRSRPLGTWVGPEYGDIADDLAEYVRSDEFSGPQVDSLVEALQGFKASV